MRFQAKLMFAACALGLSSLGSLASAQTADPAVTVIARIDDAMSAATRAGSFAGRVAALQPAFSANFNANAMAQFVVGPAWASWPAADQRAVATALSRYLTARFAQELGDAHNTTFTIDPNVQTRGPDKMVSVSAADPGDATPDRLNYRMRDAGGGAWKVIDIYYNGVSQLTTQRADLAATVPQGGAAVAARINQAAAAMH